MLVELSYADVKCLHILYNIKNKKSLLQQKIRGVHKYGEAVRFMVLDTRFPKF